MTIVMVGIGFKSMMLMEDPEITSFTRSLTTKEKNEFGPVNFGEYNFLLGVVPLVNGVPSQIPPEIGSFSAYRRG